MKPQFIQRQIPTVENYHDVLAVPEIAKFLIFASACLVLAYATGVFLPIALIIAPVFGFASLIIFNAWRARRELRQTAFDVWQDRLKAILAQYDQIPVSPAADKKWRAYFDRGYSPQRAVSLHIAQILSGDNR